MTATQTPKAKGTPYRQEILIGVIIVFMCAACSHTGGNPPKTTSIQHCQPEFNGDGSIRRMICR
ncbi:hypothetical protein N9N82_13340 [Luminiphilus sp.]|nr:hypothetical protein [Luminiphilus sp.]